MESSPPPCSTGARDLAGVLRQPLPPADAPAAASAVAEVQARVDGLLSVRRAASRSRTIPTAAKGSTHEDAELALDFAACIGCGGCLTACPNGSAHLFAGAKLAHLALLPQPSR